MTRRQAEVAPLPQPTPTADQPLYRGISRIAVVAGESSGDQLGGRLMAELRAMCDPVPEFLGVGGPAMEGQGLKSLFPLSETAIMGPAAILARLPRLARLVWRTVDDVVAFRPDVLVIIDSPEFTHALAKRVRRRLPGLPVVNLVGPTVWAWRPWRAQAMLRYVDRVASIFPFEPEAYARLGGPPCTYVGHPVVDRLAVAPSPAVKTGQLPILAVLPGSRAGEVRHLLPLFGEVVAQLVDRGRRFEAVLPTVPHLADEIATGVRDWKVRPTVVLGEEEKWAAFSGARLALAASGTVTLELAVSGVPMVVSYRISALAAIVRRLVYRAHSVAMANLMLEARAFPEFVGTRLAAATLADALDPLFDDGPEREAQLAALRHVREVVENAGQRSSRRVAELVLETAAAGVAR